MGMGRTITKGNLRSNGRVDRPVILKEQSLNAGTNNSFGGVHHCKWHPMKPGMMEAPHSSPASLAQGCRINGENDCREI